ncbi:hypothetical protein EsH8_I_001015 [Colletotrichum jinshuiense]
MMTGDLERGRASSRASSYSEHDLASGASDDEMDHLELEALTKEVFDDGEEDVPLMQGNVQLNAIAPRPRPPWMRYATKVLWILAPSFLHPADPNAVYKPLHPTAWLDGLRGVAAFFVVCHHWSLVTSVQNIHHGFRSDANPLFIQLPIIRLTVSGLCSVCVFFIVSGFALSYKPLKLIGQRRTVDFAVAAASSAFRRHIRLFLPPAVTTFIISWMSFAGWYEIPTTGIAAPALRPPRFDNAFDQLRDWATRLIGLSDPIGRNLTRGNNYVYEPTLWTIPIEFDCSLVIFLAHVAFSRLRPRVRIFFTIFLCGYTLYFAYWQYFLFFAGLLCATIHFYWPTVSDGSLPTTVPPRRHGIFARFSSLESSPRYAIIMKVVGVLSFVGALLLLSYPDGTAFATPGYRVFAGISPARFGDGTYLWIPLAAAWLVFTIDRFPFLHPIFTNRLVQYFGRISYAIYLVHGSMLWLFGWHLVQFFVKLTGSTTLTQWYSAVFLGSCIFFPGVICVADFAQRYLDANSVRLAAWFEGKLIDKTL